MTFGAPRTLKRMVLRQVQRAFGEAVRSKVAGSDAAERATQIWGKPGPRWFTPSDPVWRVHEDASMFPGRDRGAADADPPPARDGRRRGPLGLSQRPVGSAQAHQRLHRDLSLIHISEPTRPY